MRGILSLSALPSLKAYSKNRLELENSNYIKNLQIRMVLLKESKPSYITEFKGT